jgi:uncharacterized repeat protein (TIGR02543 family)
VPESQTVEPETSITLPGQGSMIAPAGKNFANWMAGDKTYGAGTPFTATRNISFVAQWTSNPVYIVSFTVGTGTGTAPASQTVETGTSITLPEQGAMIAPLNHIFDGWKTGDQTYTAQASFTVTAITEFVAQWKSTIDPNKTYIQFNNLEKFPAIIYSDPSWQTEIARAPALGTGTAVETEPKPQGTAFYPLFQLEIEGVPITYNGPAIPVRVDEKKVNPISIPALTSMETAFAYIKIENKSSSSLTLNKGNSEVAPLEAAPTIIMPGENVAYQVLPGDVSENQYKFKQGTDPLSFPADLLQFNRGVIYAFTYNGTSLTLSTSNSVLQSIPPAAPASLTAATAATAAWNRIQLTWAPVYGATSYKVYRAMGSGSLEELKEVRDTSHIDTGLKPNTAYEYQVKAMSNKSGEGPGSTRVSATTEEMPEELRSPTVSNATEMEAFLTLFNNGEYAEYTVVLADSFSLDTVALSNRLSNAVLTIQSGGSGEKTLSLSKLSIGSNVSLVLEENVTLEGLDSGNRLVQIDSGGSFTLEEGSKVHGNTGGGVSVSGTFTMSGGAISGNTASYGGGVYVYSSGTFTMSGGAISGNSSSSSSSGGGVYVNGGTFTMSGGAISGNSSSYYGGGVFVNAGTFTMSGGDISDNSSSYYGGGVYVSNNGTFTKQSGSIIYGSNASVGLKNSASSGDGHAVYVGGSPVKLRNSTVGEGATLNSAQGGSTGGWVEQWIITFDADGGYPATQTQPVSSGGSAGTMPSDPTRSGYTFGGWYTAGNGGGSQFTATTPVNGDITVYANWQCTITFNADGGYPATQTQSVTSGSSAGNAMPSDPTRSDYTFGGWYTAVNGGGSQFTAATPVTGNITVYAKWLPPAYSVQISLETASEDPPLSNISLFVNESAQFLAGSGYVSYVWCWNGEVISGATSSSYTLASNSRTKGIYELSVVVTTNTGEQLSARCRVVIKAN